MANTSTKMCLDYIEDENIQKIVKESKIHIDQDILLMTAGPTNCSPRTLKALSMPTFVAYPDLDYLQVGSQLMDEIKAMLMHVFQTKNKLTFCGQNTEYGGMETIFTNLADPGEKVIIAVGGTCGKIAVAMANNYGLDVIEITPPPRDVFSFEKLEKEIIKHKPVMLFITHGETSTGILQPLEGLSEICHKHGCLLAVDAIITFGAVPLFVDKWNIDAIVGAPQKALSAPPGLAFLSFSKRAEERMKGKKINPPFYLSAKDLGRWWKCSDDGIIKSHYTWNSNIMCAIREAFIQLLAKGLVNAWDNQRQVAEYLWKKLEEMNLKLWVEKKEIRLPNVTSVILPEGVDCRKLHRFVNVFHKIDFSFGIGPTANTCLRIGVMGYNCRKEIVDKALQVLEEALEKYPEYSITFPDSEIVIYVPTTK